MWQEIFPAPVHSTADLSALLSVYCVVEWVVQVVHDMDDILFQCLPLHHSLQRLHPETDHRVRSPHDLVQSLGISGSHAAPQQTTRKKVLLV